MAPVGIPRIGRLAVQFGMAFALAMGAAAALILLVTRDQILRETDESLANESQRATASGQVLTLAALVPRITELETRRVISHKGHLLYGADGQKVWGRLRLPLPGEGYSSIHFRDGNDKLREARALTLRLRDGGWLVVIEHSEIDENLREILPTAVIALVVVAALAGIGATWVFATLIAQRLSRTLAAADAIARGDLSRRIPDEGLDGIFASQAHSLNRMIDRMEDMVRSQRQFSSHVAHDLRTPLTRLRGLLQNNRDRLDPAGRRLVDRAEAECRSIIAIFDALLRLSEIEAGRHPTAVAPLALAAMVEDVAETMEPVIADAGSRLQLGELAPLGIVADMRLIQQLLVNLLENVALHTPQGTCAVVTLRREGDEAVVTVADNGPGIGLAERDRVVRPFERGQAPMAAQQGSGLGLAIAQAIMRFHCGALELADNRPGLAVRLRFPLGQAQAG
ncbi:MAG TPA: HAMP domain-containing sensor histidine kinase [Novosphingobium sp.]|nr:HAMP domain-containing sensor histidine kinase [Novosphingobium sp.]